MAGSARDQRERLRKGLVGEYLVMDYLDAHSVPYFAFDQNKETWSQSLSSNNLKRPDMIIWDRNGIGRLVEVKNYAVNEIGSAISIEHADIRSVKEHCGALGMRALLALVLQDRYLFFLRVDEIVPPAVSGQNYSIPMDQVPPGGVKVSKPDWCPAKAIVSWDRLLGSGLGLNQASSPAALFT